MNVISKLQKLLQPDKKIAVDKEKNSIVVKNIDNSSVYINPLDQEDLEQLRKDIQADQYELFDQLIEKLILTLNHDSTPKIRHFFRMAELKSSTDNHRFIFENDLAYFTPEEIESHHLIVDHIQEYRSALLLGYPATGKSFAVVDIAEKLALKGYRTYYFSFKKLQYWPEIWSEIKNHADPQTVFVLDDIHLQPETAGTTLNRLRHDEKLNVLFVSREVYKNRNFADTINIYTELKSTTVRTEQPSIDKKVKGIVQLYQSHFQKANQASYPIGDITKITQKVHRNLIVLNAYLRLWEKFPRLTLGELQEKDLYEDIYSTYFEQPNIDEDIRVPLLQYLCLYYFEVEFYRNPSEKEATKILIEKGIITKEEQDLYSIYHGEYALLLLKAYRFVQKRQFKRLGDNWEDFFVNQIKTYILGFKDRSSFPYPENLLEILVAIPRLTREVYGGIKDANIIFKKLIESPEIQPLLIECCEEEEDEQNIAYFLFSITRNAPHLLELFYKTFGEKVFDSAYAIGTYAHTYQVLAPLKQLAWLEDYCKPNISKILKSSSLNKIGSSLSSLAKFFPKEARFLLQSISINELVAKTQDARINDIGNALNELKNIDVAKTRAVYESIKVEVLREKMASARIHGIGKALNELKNIDFSKTQSVYAEIEVKVLREKIANARIHEIGQALNQLKNIDVAKTRAVYESLEVEVLREKIANARIHDIGKALNELKNIGVAKTRAVYESLEVEVLREKIANARIHDIGEALNELKNIGVAKTQSIYAGIEEEVLRKKITNARINDISKAFNELGGINLEKTITLCENSMDYILPGVQNTRLHYSNLIYVVSSLSRISPKIGKELYKSIAKEKLFQFDKLGNIYAFNLLAQYLLNIKLDTKDKNFKKVIASGVNQAHRFLKYRELSAVGTYINVMSRLKQNLALQLKKNLKLHTSRILKKENQQYLPRFIAGVFMHSSKLAINNLLMSYQIAFPDDKETVLKTYIEIAKNNLQVEQEKTAMVYLKKAHKIVKSLEEPSYQESIAEVLKEYDLSF